MSGSRTSLEHLYYDAGGILMYVLSARYIGAPESRRQISEASNLGVRHCKDVRTGSRSVPLVVVGIVDVRIARDVVGDAC